MWEVVASRCSEEKLFKKLHKIYREMPVLESLPNNVKCLQAVWCAILLKRDSRIGVSEPSVRRSFTKFCSWIILKNHRKTPVLESLFKESLEADVHRCSSQELFLKSLHSSQKRTCTEVFFSNVAGPQNCNFIQKRLQHSFLPVNFMNYSKRSILCRGSMNGWFWNTSARF